jgi:hypothetical protein
MLGSDYRRFERGGRTYTEAKEFSNGRWKEEEKGNEERTGGLVRLGWLRSSPW